MVIKHPKDFVKRNCQSSLDSQLKTLYFLIFLMKNIDRRPLYMFNALESAIDE